MKSWTDKFNIRARAGIKPAPTARRLSFGTEFVHERRREEGLPA